ncbi:hypothetical protein GCM10010412_081980 [Nonomuraea recticatena]|uniref:Uncharacterized protein n=2 Tax=Nonomuraea recticatena TaxID=46178 RepID=A0ABP6FIT4_9ACTN
MATEPPPGPSGRGPDESDEGIKISSRALGILVKGAVAIVIVVGLIQLGADPMFLPGILKALKL